MADIPIIPGVSVATKGILNKPLKDIICALLFGGLNNMLKGPLLCVNFDLNKIAEEAGLAGLGDLAAELKNVKDQLKAAEALCGIPETLARVNAAIAEVQSLLALDGLCAIPLKAPPIPDVIAQVIDAEFAEMNAILNDLGRLTKPSICLSGNGGFSLGGGYSSDSILESISKHVGKMGSIPVAQLSALTKRLQGVSKALDKSINRQLFPDFRHKRNLATGKPYVPNQTYVQAGIVPIGSPMANTPVPIITMDAPPALQWNPPYPPADTPNLKQATATAQMLVTNMSKTASYPVDVNGIRNENIWLAMLGPEVYAMAIGAMTPVDPLFTQQDPMYDYCGKLVGYTSTVITGDIKAIGGDPAADAQPNPPLTNFSLNWISDRDCWGVTGVESEQLITVGQDTGRKGIYLNRCPTIEIHRGYNHTFSIPSMNIGGSGIAAECFICYVGTDLKPCKENGHVVPFNRGLARLETYELLEDANGSFDDTYALQRKASFPTGTTLYFAAENRVYSGTTAPTTPTESVWWYNTVTCLAQRWTPYKSYGEIRASWNVTNKETPLLSPQNPSYVLEPGYDSDPYKVPDGNWEIITIDLNKDNTPYTTPNYESHWESIATGYWTEVSDEDRTYHWFGSSIVFNAPNVDYLAYSNKNGSVFGLLKFI